LPFLPVGLLHNFVEQKRESDLRFSPKRGKTSNDLTFPQTGELSPNTLQIILIIKPLRLHPESAADAGEGVQLASAYGGILGGPVDGTYR
jgi:hypothetical protein